MRRTSRGSYTLQARTLILGLLIALLTPAAWAQILMGRVVGVTDGEQRRISPEIELDERPGIPVAPKISREGWGSAPEIRLQVTYLEVLWAFIYAWMILYEEGVQKPLLRGESPAQIDDRTPLLSRARELFEWALGLRASYTPWPKHLPSPENYRSRQERWYGEKANLVFQEATSFMLVHEFIHAEHRHLDIRAANPPRELILELEKDADNGAFEALVNPMLNDTEKLSRGWAILAALLSSYLVTGESTAKQPTTHLPLHHRLLFWLRQSQHANGSKPPLRVGRNA